MTSVLIGLSQFIVTLSRVAISVCDSTVYVGSLDSLFLLIWRRISVFSYLVSMFHVREVVKNTAAPM